MGTDLPCATPEMGARQRERKRGSVFISRRLLRGLCTRLASRSAVYPRPETGVNPDGRRCRAATDDVPERRPERNGRAGMATIAPLEVPLTTPVPRRYRV